MKNDPQLAHAWFCLGEAYRLNKQPADASEAYQQCLQIDPHHGRALRALNPAPYLFYLALDDFAFLGSSPEVLVRVADGEVTVKGSPDRKISIPDVAAAATWTYGELITGTGAQLKDYASIVDPETGQVDLPPHSAISYAACAAEVEVDDETGEVRVLRLQQCYDVGRALNPTQVEGQIEGGAMMGLGLGVLENCYPYYPSVEHRGGAFGSYLAPAMEDMPQIDTIMIENPSVDGPYGAKGIGEMANNPQPPAIAAAVHDAIGVWITELPITPERVLRALEEKGAGKHEPRREGKKVVFDEELSVNAVSSGGMRFEVPA